MENFKDKGASIDEDINKQIEMVYDELKSYIEGLTCCDKIHHSILIREARFEHAMSKLKCLVWQKHQNKTADTPTSSNQKKQAKIIFNAVDQYSSCFIEDEDGHITTNNPYEYIIEDKKKNGDYFGLSINEYKNLLERDGYEWVVISHNGVFGSEVLSKSDGYVFKGKYKNLKVGDKYYGGYDTIKTLK